VRKAKKERRTKNEEEWECRVPRGEQVEVGDDAVVGAVDVAQELGEGQVGLRVEQIEVEGAGLLDAVGRHEPAARGLIAPRG
jgi:hypothetical protein